MTNKTTNKDGTPRKTGSGRKKGAKSFVNVTLADLQKFCGAAAAIPVSRVWLEQSQKPNKKSHSLYTSNMKLLS